MSESALARLQEHLGSAETGAVDKEALLPLLKEAWPEIEGGDEAAMNAGKLWRAHRFSWQPPELSFEIVRHRAMIAGGSSRGERQVWTVDVEQGKASYPNEVGFVQITPRSPVFKTGPVAEELADAILNGRKDQSPLLPPPAVLG